MRCLLITLLMLPVIVFAAPTPESATKDNLSVVDWQYIARKVAAGEKDWLTVVPLLASKANRQQAAQLEDALSTALPINTKGVLSTLRVLDSGKYPEMRGTDIVCVLKVVKPGKSADMYYANTRLALLDEPTGAACLWNLEGIWEETKQAQK
ncbi:hypothetical protein ABW286_13450 [Erwinia papayae]|uniref:Uncharacterized protein n=1 Tax=Erwinia papayae TaxID=206499 RepID=A0ABV3N2X2_9GAMM|nr:hypothetical protein [Erwinia mallotivora]